MCLKDFSIFMGGSMPYACFKKCVNGVSPLYEDLYHC